MQNSLSRLFLVSRLCIRKSPQIAKTCNFLLRETNVHTVIRTLWSSGISVSELSKKL